MTISRPVSTGLTPRRWRFSISCAGGITSQANGAKLELSTRTVESYRAQVMEKMQAESVAVLVRQAVRLKRIEP